MNRRTWIRGVGASVAAGVGAGLFGCGPGGRPPADRATSIAGAAPGDGAIDPLAPPPPPTVPEGRMEVPLTELPLDARTVVYFARTPVEIHRTARRTTARILVCTHWGCVVRWVPEKQWYQCPCHDGRFDEDGEVKVGPPQKALLKVPFRVEGDVLVLGN